MKKIKHNFSVLCKSSSIDGETNSVSIFNLIEEIAIKPEIISKMNIKGKEEDVIGIPFEIFISWERIGDINSRLDSEIKTSVICPNGDERDYIESPFSFIEGKKRLRLRLRTGGLPFAGFGTYYFKIQYKEKGKYLIANEIPLEIRSSTKE